MTEDELQRFLERTLPKADLHGLIVEEAQDQDVRLRFPFAAHFIGPGDIYSGPALLSFTAGFVDACTFLALFGLFVAQVTGSFVVVGAEFVTHDEGVLIKVLAIPVFFGAGLLTTICAELLRRRGHAALPWTLAAECFVRSW